MKLLFPIFSKIFVSVDSLISSNKLNCPVGTTQAHSQSITEMALMHFGVYILHFVSGAANRELGSPMAGTALPRLGWFRSLVCVSFSPNRRGVTWTFLGFQFGAYDPVGRFAFTLIGKAGNADRVGWPGK